MHQIEKKVPEKLNGYRLDMALVNLGLNLSRRKIREIIDAGGAYVDGKRVRIASRQVHKGNTIRLEYNLETLKKLKRQSFTLTASDIIFEDPSFIVINKPPGLPSQATKDQNVEHVLAVLSKYMQQRDQKRPNLILVHRLDKETSGLLIIAKDNTTATYFTECFKATTIAKEYHAITKVVPAQDSFVEECFLSSIQPKTGIVKKVHSGGKRSYTSFKVLQKGAGLSLIACFPKTGRSHQIRVHLDLNHAPILGDKKYGHQLKASTPGAAALAAEHHMLHARTLNFRHPVTGEAVSLCAPYPAKFAEILALINT